MKDKTKYTIEVTHVGDGQFRADVEADKDIKNTLILGALACHFVGVSRLFNSNPRTIFELINKMLRDGDMVIETPEEG